VPRLLSLGLIVAFALIATACGANPVPSDDVADAGENTKAAGTLRLETVSRVSVFGAAAETFEFRSTGVVDYVNDRSEHREESGGCRTIVIGDTTYGELPLDKGFPPGKRWVKSGGDDDPDGEALSEQSQMQSVEEEGGISTYSISLATSEPATHDYLEDMRKGSHEPERVGQEDVRGVSTTHYRGEVDVTSRIESDSDLEDVQEVREIDVWVDSEGRARRVVATDEMPGVEDGMNGRWVTTTEYFDFGLRAEIQAPPAAEVLKSDEWERITEKQMRKDLDEYMLELELEAGTTPLPGAFAPSAALELESAESSCLH
jgi:hypothetical protein